MTAYLWFLLVAQIGIGLCVLVGAVLTLAGGVGKGSPLLHLALFVTLAAAAAWYAIEPLVIGAATSTKPGLLFAGLVAWALLRHGPMVRRALICPDGELQGIRK